MPLEDEVVLADAERVGIVLSNLLANAMRHTPPGGTVKLDTAGENGAVRFEVADTGEGIPPEYQIAVFDKFFRVPGTTSGAAGLGLALCKEIIESQGGRIGLRSTPGRGSVFWFTLPRAPEEQPRIETALVPRTAGRGPRGGANGS